MATSEIPNDLLEQSNALGLKPMEKIPRNEYETSILDHHRMEQDDDNDFPQIPGGGISKHLFRVCQNEKIPFFMVICFAIEGGTLTLINRLILLLSLLSLLSLLNLLISHYIYIFQIIRRMRSYFLITPIPC